MPFTLAHPAAVLPLRRSRFLHIVPLVVGSLVPDVPYYLPVQVSRMLVDTHTLYGSFAVDLPWGMAALILTMVLRQPLTVLLGARVRWLLLRSLDDFTDRSFHWPVAFLSLLVGTWTHIAWDSFTHPTGWTTTHVAMLSAPVSVFGWETETSHLLQYVSSIVGLAVLGVWFHYLLRRVPAEVSAEPARSRPYWVALILIASLATLIGVSRAWELWHSGSYYYLVYLLLTRTLGWFVALYVLTGLGTTLLRLTPEEADRPRFRPGTQPGPDRLL